jgi:hypothetical protein
MSLPAISSRKKDVDEKIQVIPTVFARLSKRIGILIKKTEFLDEPLYVGRLENIDLWEEYGLHENVPLLPKYLFLDDNLDLYIIELPNEKHDYMARLIFKQLVTQCEEIDSVGSGRRNYIEADERICPSPRTPNLQLAQGVTMTSISTFVIEVGLSQKWEGKGGLDEKARKWFDIRNSLGLQYILCLKIDNDNTAQKAITNVSFKLYDLQLMSIFKTFAPTDLFLHQNGALAQIQLDARRVLSIPANQSLPQGFNGNTFMINLDRCRDDTILKGV